MRNLKFRVWDKKGNLMWYGVDVPHHKLPFLEYQQFTGLLDKQGKEIYESDLVRGFCTGNYPALIECDAPNGGYNIRKTDGEYIEIDSNTIIEVIGNIYEQPKLKEKLK